MESKPRSLVKTFAILGFILGEVFMLFTVASPRLKGVDIPTLSLTARIAAGFVFFGPFGMAAGTGIGLLVDGLRRILAGDGTDKGGPQNSDPH